TGEVVRPRAVRYRGTFAHCGSNGASASRSFPTTCVYICRVSRVGRHHSYGSSGHSSITPPPLTASLLGQHPLRRLDQGRRPPNGSLRVDGGHSPPVVLGTVLQP